MSRTTVLPTGLSDCQMWSFTMRDESRKGLWDAEENNEMCSTQQWQKQSNKFHTFHSSYIIEGLIQRGWHEQAM
jgi:hypothetical protein